MGLALRDLLGEEGGEGGFDRGGVEAGDQNLFLRLTVPPYHAHAAGGDAEGAGQEGFDGLVGGAGFGGLGDLDFQEVAERADDHVAAGIGDDFDADEDAAGPRQDFHEVTPIALCEMGSRAWAQGLQSLGFWLVK